MEKGGYRVVAFFSMEVLKKRIYCQYIPPISPPPGAIGAGGVGISVTMLSVVSKVAATDAAFCNTERVTLVGSIIPLSTISQYLLFNASKP